LPKKGTVIKKIFAVLILLCIIGTLAGCASPGNLRKDGAAFIFTTAKGTPQEFGRCLVGQLDEKLFLNVHTLRDNPNGNATILTIAGGQELRLMFDINRADNGLNILVYSEWFKNQAFRDGINPVVTEALNACGAKENIALRKE
jgi:hypothetical protein